MKKLIATLFLIFILISGIGFIFPEQLQDIINSVSLSYSLVIMNSIWIITLVLAILLTIILLLDRNK